MDRSILQDDLDRLIAWSLEWLMFFNEKKCKVMHIGKSNRQFMYTMKGYTIDTVDLEKDLGVYLSKDMKVLSQINYAYSKANKMLGLIKRTIKNKTVYHAAFV